MTETINNIKKKRVKIKNIRFQLKLRKNKRRKN